MAVRLVRHDGGTARGVGFTLAHWYGLPAVEDWRGATQEVPRAQWPGDVLVVAPTGAYSTVTYYERRTGEPHPSLVKHDPATHSAAPRVCAPPIGRMCEPRRWCVPDHRLLQSPCSGEHPEPVWRRAVRKGQRASERLPMGQLEARVMDVLWDQGDWLTPGEVNGTLSRERELAYTTVMTILVRLHGKGLVERERHGRAWAYRPVQSRDEHTAERMNAVLQAGGDRDAAMARFVDGMTAKERAQLRRLLERERRTR